MNKKVFISYSHSDKTFANNIAKDLMKNGIEVWWDQWEIQPGDSLVQKIFSEGLAKSDVFLIILSKNSINSNWVKEELDAAIIQKIEGITRVIPLLEEDVEIPSSLKSLKWLDMYSNYDNALHSLVNSIYEVSVKPPIGKIPDRIVSLKNSVGGLSKQASTIGSLLISKSEEQFEKSYYAKELHESLSFMTIDEFNDGVDELEEYGLVKTLKFIGTHPYDFGHITATYALFLHFKEELDYDPEEDIKSVAAATAEKKQIGGNELNSITSIPPVRLNRAVSYLEDYGYIKVLKTIGTAPYSFRLIDATRSTRQFVERNCR